MSLAKFVGTRERAEECGNQVYESRKQWNPEQNTCAAYFKAGETFLEEPPHDQGGNEGKLCSTDQRDVISVPSRGPPRSAVCYNDGWCFHARARGGHALLVTNGVIGGRRSFFVILIPAHA